MAIRKPGKIDVNDILLPDDEPSLLFIQRELARTNGINFEQWWDEFKKGFIGGKRDKNSNFPTSLWTNPKYTNLTPPDSTSGAMTIEYWPDKSIATESYLLSGTVANLITGVMTIMLNKSFRPVDFDTWFKGWSEGFIDFKENRTASNYPLGKTAWRAKPENRPRFREWSKPTQRSINGRIIEYWKDRSIQGESIILSGSDADLIRHVLQIEYEGGGNNQQGSLKGKGILPSLVGQPFLKLYFSEVKQVEKYKRSGEKIIRIMDKTDNPSSGLPKITKTDIFRYAQKIQQIFPGFVWEKGKDCVSYKGLKARSQGLDGWAFVKNKANGIALFEKCAAILDHPLDLKNIKFSTTEDSAGAFPENSPEVAILGQSRQIPAKRPIVDVRFSAASIVLPFLGQEIPLVRDNALLFVE